MPSTTSDLQSAAERLRLQARRTARSVGERVERVGDDAFAASRQLWLAGLGTVGAIDEQSREIFADLVSRGRRVENAPELSPLAPLRRARSEAEALGARVERLTEDRVTDGLRRLGVPARRDFESLADQVERLTHKVQAIAAAEEAAA